MCLVPEVCRPVINLTILRRHQFIAVCLILIYCLMPGDTYQIWSILLELFTIFMITSYTSGEGVQSNFWIHVSQMREGFNLPLRPSLRRESNSNQTRTLDPCLSDGLSGGFNPPICMADMNPKTGLYYTCTSGRGYNLLPMHVCLFVWLSTLAVVNSYECSSSNG